MGEPAIVIIANPRAANGRARRYSARIARLLSEAGLGADLRYTSGPMDAARLTREAVAAHADTVLAVGGDGTVNEVVNGFFHGPPETRPATALGVGQLGTGTDFSKTLRWTPDPVQVVARLRRNERRAIDVGRVDYTGLDGRRASRYFVNIAEFGSGGAVVEKVNRTTKVLGGRMSFLLAILSVMPKYANKRVRYSVDGGPERELVANNVVVANGRYFGGGLLPAPHAELDDGLLDVVVIGDIDFKTVRRHLGDLRRGTHLSLDFVASTQGREVLTVSTERALLDLDGELVGYDPTRFVCVPRALDLLV